MRNMSPNRLTFVLSAMCATAPKKNWQRIAATTALSTLMFTAAIPRHVAVAAAPPSEHTEVAVVAAPQADRDEEHALVDEAWRIVDNYFYDPTFNQKDWAGIRDKLQGTPLPNRIASYAALRRNIRKLNDPYTRVLTARDMQALRKFDVSGVGLLLTASEDGGDLVVVTTPDTDTPAGRAGVRRGDVVLAIDGRDVRGVNAFQVAEWMQGAEGSIMRVRFRDLGETSLVRSFAVGNGGKSVSRVAVVARDGERMGYIRLVDFEASSRQEIGQALHELREQGADWVVLDLRSNGGGVFEGALEIAGFFEGDGVQLVSVRGRPSKGDEQELQERYLSRVIGGGDEVDWGSSVDVAILMNGRSASSSEVLAGGLRDNCKAALVGGRSYGKGLIQGVFGLSDGGGVVVTVAEYRTPSGQKINGVGLESDLKLRRPLVDNLLRGFGIERMREDSFIVSHDDVKDALRLCRASKSEDGRGM